MTLRRLVMSAAAVLWLAATASALVEIGRPAPAIAGTTMDGKRFNLADYKGKSGVLLNFYASW